MIGGRITTPLMLFSATSTSTYWRSPIPPLFVRTLQNGILYFTPPLHCRVVGGWRLPLIRPLV
jgi:hypothetical protein